MGIKLKSVDNCPNLFGNKPDNTELILYFANITSIKTIHTHKINIQIMNNF